MYEFFDGQLVRKSPGTAVIECGGVGYALRISLASFDALPSSGRVRLWAHLESGGEAGIRLFGFATEHEREVFRLLLNVQGVGPATALSILSAGPVDALSRAIADGDHALLRRFKGVGPKTAQRLVLDLQETFKGFAPSPDPRRTLVGDAILALVALSIPRPAAEKAVRDAEAALGQKAARAEDLVREALRRL
ncbi:MAG: Holliday junction branch migration protein RuvA [Candidatus Brocadiae bacterium]|nr:Holliday junction branch migration protein RuvA [Candidatus Brocadiia bacterium]